MKMNMASKRKANYSVEDAQRIVKRSRKEQQAVSITNLPREIQLDIFCRAQLPIKTIFNLHQKFTYSSKVTAVLSDSMFIESQNNHSRSCIFTYDNFRKLEFFLIEAVPSIGKIISMQVNMTEILGDDKGDFNVLGTCNGLLLMSHRKEGCGLLLSVVNPLTKKSVALPQPELSGKKAEYAFGFDKKSYKVLRHVFYERMRQIDNCIEQGYYGEILTVGTNTWKMIDGDFPQLEGWSFQDAVTIEGALHWLGNNSSIAAFDLDTEKFRFLSLPPLHEDGGDEGHEDLIFNLIGVINNKLYVGAYSMNVRNPKGVVIWVLERYGEWDSWRQSITIPNDIHLTRSPLKLVEYDANDKSLIMIEHPMKLVYYDAKMNEFTGLGRVRGISHKRRGFVFHPNFMSLRHV